MPSPFPAKLPLEKPDRELSASMERMYDIWNPHEDRGNEFFSNSKYSPLEGFSRESNVSRRDPSKVLRIDGTYYVWCSSPLLSGSMCALKKICSGVTAREIKKIRSGSDRNQPRKK